MSVKKIKETKFPSASRVNIPTAELESMAEEQEKQSQALLYPRDASLDPQLVWKGKDEQDRGDLGVPVVPIYIQEQISPRALIEDLRKRTDDAIGPNFFADFNGLDFQQRVDYYQHEQRWTNRMILGDSLLVMASLAEKEGLKGKVQMIYIDPPYGIKFGSNWQVSTRKRDVRDGKAEDATRQPEQIRAFRDTWDLGIHSYLSYLRDRLTVAHDLLGKSGSVFLQIGDENMHLARSVLDEVFGASNFISQITVQKMAGLSAEYLNGAADFILWYGKDRTSTKYRQLFHPKVLGVGHGSGARYDQLMSPSGEKRPIPRDSSDLASLLQAGWKPFQLTTLMTFGTGGSSYYPFRFRGKEYLPSAGKGWLTTPAGMENLSRAGRIADAGRTVRYVRYLDDFPSYEINNVWTDIASTPDVIYAVQTNQRIVQRCMLMATEPGDLVLDPTCGSGTTAYVAEQWGRRWITVDTSRVALALARTRLMSARYPYYILADTPEGVRKEYEASKRVPPADLPPTTGDISHGFVYKRVPHVTLKSIANNPDIREGIAREEIDAAILRHADTELLYDNPYEDKDIVRVSGPFTVESLSPHRMLPVADESRDAEPLPAPDSERFIGRIVDNLRKAGVQNTIKNQRLQFDRIEPWPGSYIQAAGEYTEDGAAKRVAVCIGPEYGTVGPELIREAAKEASKFADLVIVCGFAFEAIVGEEATKLGRMQILKAKMNPDLSMGDELLKKTGAGNLFMVFGEPDISVTQQDGQCVVEIRGVDIYDPTTGAIRSHDTDDIACWFIDTNYNEESFFVRHAYFVGAGDPYENLKKALRADIDEAVWETLYRTTSRPFKKPDTGKIAIKVINHYGDEVLKVYRIP